MDISISYNAVLYICTSFFQVQALIMSQCRLYTNSMYQTTRLLSTLPDLCPMLMTLYGRRAFQVLDGVHLGTAHDGFWAFKA